MFNPEEELIGIMGDAGVDFSSSLPCEKIKFLLRMVEERFYHVPLTREEEGVGISAGAALAGRRPAMFVQSSGIGNMLNALLSLTQFYELPLALFVSQRGVYKERIAAQLPMGLRLPKILRGAGISCSAVASSSDFGTVGRRLREIYRKNIIHAFLLSPAIWEGSAAGNHSKGSGVVSEGSGVRGEEYTDKDRKSPSASPKYARYEIIKTIAPFLAGKAVVCNLGIPSKELHAVFHQPSNFYMLGSMGMATPIGLGISLSSRKEVVVIDGDGSLLMNPNTLATAACMNPDNLTILAIDNSAYGSTGNQGTLTGACVDLEEVARGCGIRNTIKTATRKGLVAAMRKKGRGPKFIHALALCGNSDSPNISLHHLEIRKQVQGFLARG